MQELRHKRFDRNLIWNPRHILRALHEFEDHHNRHCRHQALDQAAQLRPVPQPVTDSGSTACLDIRPTRSSRGIHPRIQTGGVTCADVVFGRRSGTGSAVRIPFWVVDHQRALQVQFSCAGDPTWAMSSSTGSSALARPIGRVRSTRPDTEPHTTGCGAERSHRRLCPLRRWLTFPSSRGATPAIASVALSRTLGSPAWSDDNSCNSETASIESKTPIASRTWIRTSRLSTVRNPRSTCSIATRRFGRMSKIARAACE